MNNGTSMSYQGGPTLVFRMDEESSQGTVTPPVRITNLTWSVQLTQSPRAKNVPVDVRWSVNKLLGVGWSKGTH